MGFCRCRHVPDRRWGEIVSGRYVLATISLDEMAGGLERNIVNLANRLVRKGHNVGLLTFDWESARSFYAIDEGVRWYKVATSQPHAPISFGNRLRLLLGIRRVLKDANASVVVCFQHGILARFILASLFMKIRIVVSERNSLTLYDHIKQSKWSLNFLLMFLVDRITVQFPQYVKDYPRWLRSRIVVIPNSVLPAARRAQPGNGGGRRPFELLAVGRLCAQKNYEALIAAFASVAPRHTDWHLVIVGDGGMREQLLTEIARHKLEHCARLIPATPSVFDAYESAALLCIPSKWEGFPNALAEAMAHGLPAIGYQGCAGVKEMIAHGENGLLAIGNGNVKSLSEALERLMANPIQRERMGKAAEQCVRRFDPDRIFPRWENLLGRIGNPR